MFGLIATTINMIASSIYYVGLISVAGAAYKFYRFINFHFFGPGIAANLRRYLHPGPSPSADNAKKEGKAKPAWALVTGSTSGIGLSLSSELAAAGFNIILHGRSPTKLERVHKDLSAKHPNREFKLLVGDAKDASPQAVEKLVKQVEGWDLNLTVLINNAGGGYLDETLDWYCASGTKDASDGDVTSAVRREEELLEVLAVNAIFPTLLLGGLIPTIARNAPALVINIGSMSDSGLPLVNVYGASKAYVSSLTQSVALEMALTGRTDVEVVCMRVGRTLATGENTGKEGQGTLFEPDATTMARSILNAVGRGAGAVVMPYWGHAVQDWASGITPSGIKSKVMVKMMNELRDSGTLNPEKAAKRKAAAAAASADKKADGSKGVSAAGDAEEK